MAIPFKPSNPTVSSAAYNQPRDPAATRRLAAAAPTREEMERRRAAVLKLSSEGWTQIHIAKALRVSEVTVSRWVQTTPPSDAAQTIEPDVWGGKKPRVGRPIGITDAQLRGLVESRPEQRKWTGGVLQRAIIDVFGVTYSIKHCCLLLRYLRDDKYATRYEATQAVRPRAKAAEDGRPPLLNDAQLRAIFSGHPDEWWTGSAFRHAIRDEFGVAYSLGHCCGLLKYLRGCCATRFDANRAKGASA